MRNNRTFPATYVALVLAMQFPVEAFWPWGDRNEFQVRGVAEFGALSVLTHQVQFGREGTGFDYVERGGQELLFPVSRYSLEMDAGARNTFILLYQPLRIESRVSLGEDVIFNGIGFPAASSLETLYSFPFYRFSYMRELTQEGGRKFALGLTLQIRNALITFASSDGTRFTRNADVGLVPALKIRWNIPLGKRLYTEVEADGIYAPISYLNGSDNEVEGAILDAGLRLGAKVRKPMTTFLNIRYLGGGATGTSEKDGSPGDGYVDNWLQFLIVSAGLIHDF